MKFQVVAINGTKQVQIRLQAVVEKGGDLTGGTIDLRLTPAAAQKFEHNQIYDFSAVLSVILAVAPIPAITVTVPVAK